MEDALTLHNALVARGSRPALTWYCPQGRMELSGTVAANHLAKISAFLGDEAWTEPGDTALVLLPCHWKSVLWALGAMLAGLDVRLGGRDGEAASIAVAITNKPAEAPAARETVAVDMNPLAFGWSGAPLPDGVLDGSAGQIAQPDTLADTERHRASNFAAWAARATLPEGDRILVRETTLERALTAAAVQLSRGSLVVVDRKGAERAEAEKAIFAKLADTPAAQT